MGERHQTDGLNKDHSDGDEPVAVVVLQEGGRKDEEGERLFSMCENGWRLGGRRLEDERAQEARENMSKKACIE